MTQASLAYIEALDDWAEADCQMRLRHNDPHCGHPAVVHRPNRLVIRFVCACHADPDELDRAAVRSGQPVTPCSAVAA
ncbi:hypothetical protein AB0B63_18585 [Micromonospora sp. NPDC049081]|uniref:hypothetical protein n=1 Tax=Micromonospora sp. NPDC049081 TaxID=3155150 RepID=UPI0033C95A63